MIFVTGGTGMLGAHLLLELTTNGKTVRALKRPTSSLDTTIEIFKARSSDAERLLKMIEWVNGDLMDAPSIQPLLNGVTQIFHTAAMVSFDSRDRDTLLHNNTLSTTNLVDLAIESGVTQFCHVSSVASLGIPPEGVAANEDHAWTGAKNKTTYALSKHLSEMEIWRAIYQGMEAVILNPSVIVGPGRWDIGSPKLFSSVWKGLKFYTKGGTGFVDVQDVARAMRQLMLPENWEKVKNQRYVLNAENMGFYDFFGKVAAALHKPKPTIYASDFVLGLAWRLAAVVNLFQKSSPAITKESVSGSNKQGLFDGTKITKVINFTYKPMEQSINETASIFLAAHKSKF